MQPGPDHHACAVILTALPVEYIAVREQLEGEVTETVHRSGTIYEEGTFHPEGGPLWSIAIVQTGRGNSKAAMEAERMIESFRPHVAVFVGVAGGIKDVKLGDVVAATKVYGYEYGKITTTFELRTEIGRSTYPMEQRAAAEAKRLDWIRRINGGAPTDIPRVFVEPIAAGEKVVAEIRSGLYDFLRQNCGDAIATEMEGHGILTATHANPGVDALIVRGISDLIGNKDMADKQGFQLIASRHAAAFAFQVLANFRHLQSLSLPEGGIRKAAGKRWVTPDMQPPPFSSETKMKRDDGIQEHNPLALEPQGGTASIRPDPSGKAGRDTRTIRYQIELDADIDEHDESIVDRIVDELRTLAGDRLLKLIMKKKGSLVLVLDGSKEGFEQLRQLASAGLLNHILQFRTLSEPTVIPISESTTSPIAAMHSAIVTRFFVDTSFLLSLVQYAPRRDRRSGRDNEQRRHEVAKQQWFHFLALRHHRRDVEAFWSPMVIQEFYFACARSLLRFYRGRDQLLQLADTEQPMLWEEIDRSLSSEVKRQAREARRPFPEFVQAVLPLIRRRRGFARYLTIVGDWPGATSQDRPATEPSLEEFEELIALGSLTPADCVIALSAARVKASAILTDGSRFLEAASDLRSRYGIVVTSKDWSKFSE